MTLSDRVVAILNDAGVAHALIGAAALAAAGVARSTLDLDLLTVDARVLDPMFWSGLRQTGARVDVRRGDADDPLAGVIRATQAHDRPVDVIVGRHAWQQRAIDRAQTLSSGLRVALPRDIVLLKLFAGGTQDKWDIRQLLDAGDSSQLVADVDAELGDLPRSASSIWAEILRRQ
jgi:hypothetical protein